MAIEAHPSLHPSPGPHHWIEELKIRFKKRKKSNCSCGPVNSLSAQIPLFMFSLKPTSPHHVFSECKLDKSLCYWKILTRRFACKGEGSDISTLEKSNSYKFLPALKKIVYKSSSVVYPLSMVVPLRFLTNYPVVCPSRNLFQQEKRCYISTVSPSGLHNHYLISKMIKFSCQFVTWKQRFLSFCNKKHTLILLLVLYSCCWDLIWSLFRPRTISQLFTMFKLSGKRLTLFDGALRLFHCRGWFGLLPLFRAEPSSSLGCDDASGKRTTWRGQSWRRWFCRPDTRSAAINYEKKRLIRVMRREVGF